MEEIERFCVFSKRLCVLQDSSYEEILLYRKNIKIIAHLNFLK